MSEFKFACPVCGQHITADSSTSGGRIECPTCFRKIVVPQAPASTDARLIISASQADKPKPPLTPGDPLEPSPGARKSFPIAAILLILVLGGIVSAIIFRDTIFKPPAAEPGSDQAKAGEKKTYPVPKNIKWTLSLTNAVLPAKTAVGSIHGSGFKCERATLQGGTLNLRQGKSWPPDLGVTINLFAKQGEELSGKAIEVSPDRSPPLPKIVLRWKDSQDQPAHQNISQGYALKVVFGDATNSRMPGKIFLSLPDEAKSFVAGSFNAEIRKPAPPKAKQPKASKTPKNSG